MLSFELDEGKAIDCDGLFQTLLLTFVLHNSIKGDIYEFFEKNEQELDRFLDLYFKILDHSIALEKMKLEENYFEKISDVKLDGDKNRLEQFENQYLSDSELLERLYARLCMARSYGVLYKK